MILLLMIVFWVIMTGVLAYPLFFQPPAPYLSLRKVEHGVSERNAVLNTLTELEEDYELGKLSKKDYEDLKLYFQRQYLSLKKRG